MINRWAKSLLVMLGALYSFLAGFDNVIDYQANLPFMQHVLMMDTTFRSPSIMGRAITSPTLHHAAFVAIIMAELAVGVIAGLGAVRMMMAGRNAKAFAEAKDIAIAGLMLAVLIWFGGFLIIAGNWFAMWQSSEYNAQEAAFFFAVPFMLILAIIMPAEPQDPARMATLEEDHKL
jgi:predicted small integral membrane protein